MALLGLMICSPNNPLNTLKVAVASCAALGFINLSSADSVPPSLDPQPRLESYSWMPLAEWFRMHADDVEIAETGEVDLLFVGDSITQGWGGGGARFWNEQFAPRRAANFGIGGDMTQNVLWRLDHGGQGKLQPKAIVLLIGVNNFGFLGDVEPWEVASGVLANIDDLLGRFPDADLLWMDIFPMGEKADHPNRGKISAVNRIVREAIAGNARVTAIDLTEAFLADDGSLPKELMPDFLHPNEAGYQIWTDAILPWVDERVPLVEDAAGE